jgi:hypothetical protein
VSSREPDQPKTAKAGSTPEPASPPGPAAAASPSSAAAGGVASGGPRPPPPPAVSKGARPKAPPAPPAPPAPVLAPAPAVVASARSTRPLTLAEMGQEPEGTPLPEGVVERTPAPSGALDRGASIPAPAAAGSPATGDAAALELQGGSDPLIGELVAERYKVLRLIGLGGMGRVYEAEHSAIRKRLALKVLNPEYSRQPDLTERFLREAQAASRIGHPNIIDVSDFGHTASGQLFFVMELLEGTNLADLITREGALAAERACGIGAQICRALAAAHAVGIIHRDLKAENIFLIAREGTPDFVKVLDFGIAKTSMFEKLEKPRRGARVAMAKAARRLTRPGEAMGTVEYMAPEQASGMVVDHRADIYSLGVLLFEMVTGKLPFDAEDPTEILNRKATEPPPVPSQLRPDAGIPPELDQVIMRALDRQPHERPATMGQLEYDLNKCFRGRGVAVARLLGLDINAGPEASRSGVYGLPEQAVLDAGFTGSGSGRLGTLSGVRLDAGPAPASGLRWVLLALPLAAVLAVAIYYGPLRRSGGGASSSGDGPAARGTAPAAGGTSGAAGGARLMAAGVNPGAADAASVAAAPDATAAAEPAGVTADGGAAGVAGTGAGANAGAPGAPDGAAAPGAGAGEEPPAPAAPSVALSSAAAGSVSVLETLARADTAYRARRWRDAAKAYTELALATAGRDRTRGEELAKLSRQMGELLDEAAHASATTGLKALQHARTLDEKNGRHHVLYIKGRIYRLAVSSSRRACTQDRYEDCYLYVQQALAHGAGDQQLYKYNNMLSNKAGEMVKNARQNAVGAERARLLKRAMRITPIGDPWHQRARAMLGGR